MQTRTTKYSQAILTTLEKLGHATNAELLAKLRLTYPELSATTVHRVTQRLEEQGTLAYAPASPDGSKRYDFNTKPHDHFTCVGCLGIKDIDVVGAFLPIITKELGDCEVTGRLTISGQCGHCLYKEEDL